MQTDFIKKCTEFMLFQSTKVASFTEVWLCFGRSEGTSVVVSLGFASAGIGGQRVTPIMNLLCNGWNNNRGGESGDAPSPGSQLTFWPYNSKEYRYFRVVSSYSAINFALNHIA